MLNIKVSENTLKWRDYEATKGSIAAKVNMADQEHALAYVEDLWRLGVRGYFPADLLRHKHQHAFARAEVLSNW